MTFRHLTPAFIALSAAAAGLFPQVSELDPALLMPPDSEKVEIARDGTFLVNGKPRFLLGTVLYHTPSLSECAHGPGYADEDAWIYETIPDRDYLQRLGFDTVGGEVSTTWMQAFRPEKSFWQGRRQNDWSLASRYWKSGLPTIVDFTCATWSHGALRAEEGREPSISAIPKGGAGHFMPYSLVTREGRDLYARMWRSGAEELRTNGVKPYAYELFNEPTYDDRSPEARAVFAAQLSSLFKGDPAAMDQAWGSSYGSFEAASSFKHPNECPGLGVEWLKFCEARFASGIALGRDTIREVDPDARVCFQPLGMNFGRVDMLEANWHCGVVMSPTGGGDLYDSLVLKALAFVRGKPIIDGEAYLGHTRASHRAKILLEWARGFNASYYFKWERRLWDPVLKGENGPARLAEKFPWLALNPASTPTEALAGLMDAKREIMAMEDLFGPRNRGPGRTPISFTNRIASLVSQSTERLGFAAGHANHTFSRVNATAMARDAHLPVDAVFEEQFLDRWPYSYNFIVAAGIDAKYRLMWIPPDEWCLKFSGTLVLLQEALQLDEWGRDDPTLGIMLGTHCSGEAQRFEFRGASYEAVPYREVTFATNSDWQVIVSLPDGHPAIARRTFGEGSIWYVGVRFPTPGDEGRLIASLAADCGIRPTCATLYPGSDTPVDGIEVHAARGADGAVGFVAINQTLSARAIRFIPGADFPASILLDISRDVALTPDADGVFLLLLEPNVPLVLRGAPSIDALSAWRSSHSSLVTRHSSLSSSSHSSLVTRHSSLTLESYSNVFSRVSGWLAEHAPKTAAKAFSVDPARVRCLDLRAVANRSYGDKVAGDGEGGWTDQGENHLRHAPWGVTDCNGVPFDFIRPDQNDDRACVILRSTRQPYLPDAVRDIAVNLRAEALYFLHAGAWLRKGEEAFRYIVHYADGTTNAVPMVADRDFGDWWIDRRRAGLARTVNYVTGWVNSEGRGFHALRWENPCPDKTIATIDIESACGDTIPIIEAITVELTSDSPFARHKLKLKGWGGVKPEARDGGIELSVTDATENWAGANLRLREAALLPPQFGDFDLVFEANGGRTPLGRDGVGGQPFQVSVEFKLADGSGKSGPYIRPAIEGGAIDDDPKTWQTVRIPLRRLLPKDVEAVALSAISVQNCVLPVERAGLIIRAIRLDRR